MVITYSLAKAQGQWSAGFEDREETHGRMDRWMEATALSSLLMWSVIKPIKTEPDMKQ